MLAEIILNNLHLTPILIYQLQSQITEKKELINFNPSKNLVFNIIYRNKNSIKINLKKLI